MNIYECIDTVSKSIRVIHSPKPIFYFACSCIACCDVGPLIDINFMSDRNIRANGVRGLIPKSSADSEYLIEFRDKFDKVLELINSDKPSLYRRNWLIDNIRGFSIKSATKLLVATGARDIIVVDDVVVDFLGLDHPKNKLDYLELESKFIKSADLMGVDPVLLRLALLRSNGL